MPNNFQIPDLTKLCGDHFELRVNEHCHAVIQDSHRFLLNWQLGIRILANRDALAGPGDSDTQARERHDALQIPLLAAVWYPTCDFTQLKTATELLTLLFYHSESPYAVQDVDGEQARQAALDAVVGRISHAMSGRPSWLARFRSTLASFKSARRTLAEQHRSRTQCPSSMDDCLALRQSSEMFGVAFDLIEYTEDLDVADEVMCGELLCGLKQNALDAVIWMKEIVSYNVQQSRGDANSNNLIDVMMKEQGIALQAAIKIATNNVRERLQAFVELASGSGSGNGRGTDALDSEDARRYVLGLRDCVAGWAHWVYETEAYFSKNGEEVKAFGWVFLLPKEGEGKGEDR